MPDPTFFKKVGSFTVQEIADRTGATLGEGADPDAVLDDVAPLNSAKSSDLSFLDNIKYKDQFTQTKAGACFVVPDMQEVAPKGLNLLITPQPYKAYARAAQAFYPDPKPEGRISEAAHIDDSAEIAEGCVIEPGVVIADGVKIGKDSWIESNAVIGVGVQIGQGCRVGPNSTLSHCHIGDHTRLYPGVRIGQDGFGFAIDPQGHLKIPQLGRVIIEAHCEIGANTTIDRGAGPDTVIGQGTWIDNLVQIGHNVKIGRGCILVSQSGISGSTVLEDFVAIGGQAGVAGHLKIGVGARIAGQSGVMRDIPAGQEQMGTPALPIKQYMKQVALLKRMMNKNK